MQKTQRRCGDCRKQTPIGPDRCIHCNAVLFSEDPPAWPKSLFWAGVFTGAALLVYHVFSGYDGSGAPEDWRRSTFLFYGVYRVLGTWGATALAAFVAVAFIGKAAWEYRATR